MLLVSTQLVIIAVFAILDLVGLRMFVKVVKITAISIYIFNHL